MATAPLIVIVGPTASGKTALAITLAEQFDGEIICADSRTVYKGMDIGTAKPSATDQQRVPHWGLDLVEPGERFTAAEFQSYATDKIAEIRSRGHVPFLVGGTGLYIDSVVYEYQFGEVADQKLRQELELLTLAQLYEYCKNNNVMLPENDKNKRYVVRAIEQKLINNRRRASPIPNTHIVGITTEKEALRAQIERRIEQLLTNGVVEEAKKLGNKYGWDSEAMTGNIYPLVHKYLEGSINDNEFMSNAVTLDWRLAKRQLTWLRRNHFVRWFSLDDASVYLAKELAAWQES